jgi:hypothetical protein
MGADTIGHADIRDERRARAHASAEVAIRGGHAALIRPRFEPAEWLERQLLPRWPAR